MPEAAARYAVLIPARYASTRLPGKVLLRESGKYLVEHVYERALDAPGSPRVLVLTDDDRVEAAVRSFGGEAMRTRADHASGTDRCAEAARRIAEPVVVNLQGDEPLVHSSDLARLAAAAAEPGVDVATLGHPFARREDEADPHSVKALRGRDGFALDFRRASPPDAERRGVDVLHHVGVYAFRRTRLLDFAALLPTPRERSERLEQLRALESGWKIRVLDAAGPGSGVDTREDYDEFLRALRAEKPRGKRP